MSNKKLILLAFILLSLVLKVNAQWDMPITQFWTMKESFNPSFLGEKGELSLSALYKQQWIKAKDAPQTLYLSANKPFDILGLYHGVGVIMSNTNVGNERNSFVAAQYSYKQKIGTGWLNAGIQIGHHTIRYDASSMYLREDSNINNQKYIVANPVDKQRLDIGAGLSWTSKYIFAGVGARHINEPKYYSVKIYKDNIENNINDSIYTKIPLSYNLMLGCNIKLFNTLFEVEPMVFTNYNVEHSVLYTALQFNWDKKYSLGAMWRGDEGYSFFVGAEISGVEVSYAFDKNNKGQMIDAGVNHEIVIQYNFGLDLFNPKPQSYKSIRLL